MVLGVEGGLLWAAREERKKERKNGREEEVRSEIMAPNFNGLFFFLLLSPLSYVLSSLSVLHCNVWAIVSVLWTTRAAVGVRKVEKREEKS
jgi:hypothetical protein